MPPYVSGRAPDPRSDDIRALLTRSGNRCAFPGCRHPIVTAENVYVAQICHIEAAAPGGPRYNSESTDSTRRSESNLLLLCYQHHVITHDVVRYPTSVMLEMKRAHEALVANAPFRPTDEVVARVFRESEQYWLAVGTANLEEHIVPDLRVPIDPNASPRQLLEQVHDTLLRLSSVHGEISQSYEILNDDIRATMENAGLDVQRWDAIPHYENPAIGRDWELVNLAFPNLESRMFVALAQMKLFLLEAELRLTPHNATLRAEVERLRAEFLQGARSWGLVD